MWYQKSIILYKNKTIEGGKLMREIFRKFVVGFKGDMLVSSEKVVVAYALTLFLWGIVSTGTGIMLQQGMISSSLDMVVYNFTNIAISLGILYVTLFINYYKGDVKKTIDKAKVTASYILVALVLTLKLGFNLAISDVTLLIAVGTLLFSWAMYKKN